jgi:effector-binding domain-containing protein
VTTHVGPFEGLEAAWTAFRARIDELGRRRADDPWEVYFVGPGSGVDEAEWRTELVWPLEPPEPPADAPDGAAASVP